MKALSRLSMSTTPTDAYVLIESDNTHWAAALLHRDHRHVWCLIPDDRAGMWIRHDYRIGGIIVDNFCTYDIDIEDFFRDEGISLFKVPYTPEHVRKTPFSMNNCVGVTKTLIGINCGAKTPWQLYRFLHSRGYKCDSI